MALVLREMASRYGRSPGGYAWAILEPLGMIVLLAFAFSLLVRTPSLGTSFLLFYATGFLPYQFFQKHAQMTSSALSYSRSLLTYPVVTWVDAVLARYVLNGLTGLLVAYILVAGIIATNDVNVNVDLVPVAMAMGMASLMGVGIGMINCVLFNFFPIWRTIWGILTRPLFLASGVLMIMEDLPSQVQDYLWYNPLMHISGLLRTGFYPMYSPQYVSKTFVMAVSLTLVAFGIMLMRRYNREVINK
ncbi:ABC transporter permease [Alphaproteobacteria bacterium KMM 3653]|uniref:Transport permease protein n=1 Tax=Harenicola maris TaxID=2841044 RepID=A0AAP2CRA4_9RHOB|nr:ABC transporter permease [Harenicola maris]